MGVPDLRCAWHARLVSETRRVMRVCYTTYRTAVVFAICAALTSLTTERVGQDTMAEDLKMLCANQVRDHC
ncbi:hypothetical protein BDV39DRAFT_182833 [Aspergillus sergii]|uniref:Uncharacterized protein n=1 Tax=Aspergillus sergii TaxID=1034303 RepID=A0A5N6WT59_9EURO|nr:hypothetical protein BDV39DRAFT_182833 [Aspergillus sergii]